MENIYLGNTAIKSDEKEIKGEIVQKDGEKFYKISHFDQMSDFFMTMVSVSDHWLFISSNGSLTAGRKDRNNAMFPYNSVDKIHDSYDISGSKTIILVNKGNKKYLWEPFSKDLEGIYKISRNIFKSIYNNKIIFEEINVDLGISFQYGWYFSDKFGFVKKSNIANLSNEAVTIDILDGIKNIMPSGFDYNFQKEFSNLLDAYKKNELIPESNLGLFSLSSIPVDKAEPSESLKATTVWTRGLQNPKILISDRQIEDFRKGLAILAEKDIKASRGAYYVNDTIKLESKANKEWIFVAEINQDSTSVANLNHFLTEKSDVVKLVSEDIQSDTLKLIQLVASADGLQLCNEKLETARHYANTLYNIMRGGIFIDNYKIEKYDFIDFVRQTNKVTFNNEISFIEKLPDNFSSIELLEKAARLGNPDFERICSEYLPLTFSRRHGDPSRPWNQFSIEINNPDGSMKSDYQGNWRDIFQNWEALAFSFPEFIEQMIGKFVNATTPDGYNPYRITRNGIDWERPDPDDPWAFIGYWGDHQIIYLQKLLEISHDFHPGKIHSLLDKEIFAYANVPYRIKPYQQIVEKPQDTIVFDRELNNKIDKLTLELGADGKLLFDSDKHIYKTNLTEKILVSLLSKLSNFIPEAGIWLNTQRPEWNDANNALVGNGVSMVTLYYIRRFLKFWSGIFSSSQAEGYLISEEVKILFQDIHECFIQNQGLLKNGFSDVDRRKVTDILGEAGSRYRNKIYNNSFSGAQEEVSVKELVDFTKLSLEYMDQSIQANKRNDGLYHAYNLVSFTHDSIRIRHLYEMLEGQVAVLSSGYLSAEESLNVLDALKSSSLFRKDQYSYILYPDRTLPLFIEKNIIPNEDVESSTLLKNLLENKDTSIVKMDENGRSHFNSSIRNVEVLEEALNILDRKKYGDLVEKEREQMADIYEKMFDHQSFTGRSGTFYGFEGLGSIYWHMVSKLLLATQETFFRGMHEGANKSVLNKINDHYYEIKAGIGLYKSPKLYGAMPTDAYSHTPAHAGAQQPGMTGQVKEDFLARMTELGFQIKNGEIVFDTSLINQKEFLDHEESFEYYDLEGNKQEIKLHAGQLGFTFCQVPVIYTLSDEENITVSFKDGKKKDQQGNAINKEVSSKIFKRSGEVERIEFSTLSH